MRAEDLFELIDGIDDDIILDIPRLKSIKPTKVIVEHTKPPVWAVALLAACLVCVLAVGVFFAAKLQSGPPVYSDNPGLSNDSDSTSSSDSDSGSSDISETSQSSNSDSDSSDSSSFIPTEFTDEELQDILKELWPAVDELNGMFMGWDAGGTPYTFKYSYKYFGSFENQYCLIPEGTRTETNGLFVIPQTYTELEELLLEYFTAQSADKYMLEVNKGKLIKNADGTFTLEVNDKDNYKACLRTPQLLEIGGKMYCSMSALGERVDLDIEQSKVIEKTDDSIRFSCVLYNGDPDLSWNAEGLLLYERGGWKLHYHRDSWFDFSADTVEALIENFPVDEIIFPDGSTASKYEAAWARNMDLNYELGFDYSFIRYAKAPLQTTLDDPELYDWETYEYKEKEPYVYAPEYFKVKAGDKLSNGLTVKSASYSVGREITVPGIVFSEPYYTYRSEVEYEGQLTLSGVLYWYSGPYTDYKGGKYIFFADPSQSDPIPMTSHGLMNKAGPPDYEFLRSLSDDADHFAAISEQVKFNFNNIDKIQIENIVAEGEAVKVKITIDNIRTSYALDDEHYDLTYSRVRIISADLVSIELI